jgi:hypothetical protein
MFETPFAYFVFLSWSGFIFALVVYITVFKISHFKNYVEKW